ncbi:hypothetical protein GA0115253_107857 [Streptomyces sp. Termitarium-T10T-6]|nr:hypothetical protein [Streptomyces sp. Termitarium-T10T-6]SCE58526.1 hypothetical protein GA0115253_107857 [Streptomyces sp. Termitarium-T10T-6]
MWHSYWEAYGLGYGLFQAFMVTVWVTSGIVTVVGIPWLIWLEAGL